MVGRIDPDDAFPKKVPKTCRGTTGLGRGQEVTTDKNEQGIENESKPGDIIEIWNRDLPGMIIDDQ